jgi:hypothetical protein
MSKDDSALILSFAGLAQVQCLSRPNDFSFSIGGYTYNCPLFSACFISPRVSRLYATDRSIDEFELAADDPHQDFALFISLMRGEPVVPTDEQKLFLAIVAQELENDEILRFLAEVESQPNELTMTSFEGRLIRRAQLGLSIERELCFAATHFSDLSSEVFQRLGRDICAKILEHPTLSIDSEDALLASLIVLPDAFAPLLDYVECRFLSESGIDQFIRAVTYDKVTEGIWMAMCRRARADGSLPRGRQFVRQQWFEFTGNPLNGIIASLRKPSDGKNPHESGQVEVTASSTFGHRPWQVLDHSWKDTWRSQNLPNSWIQIDFKQYRVCLSGYALRRVDFRTNIHISQNWVIEGSTDGLVWRILDSQKVDGLPQTKFATYPVESEEYFRYVRMRKTAKTQTDGDCLVLTNIEVFGRIRSYVDP